MLSHPLTKGLSIDDPKTTQLRKKIILEKPFLKRIYEEWYMFIASSLPQGKEPILELGSGAGFLREFIPGLIASDILQLADVDIILDGYSLPFRNSALRGIIMVNVFHHLCRPKVFLKEATRCVQPAGVLLMIEPWVTPWSRWVYQRLHHEPFLPQAQDWGFERGGPLSAANGALAWIVFDRDRKLFETDFSEWKIQEIKLIMPFRYLVSGGVSLKNLVPGWSYPFWKNLEKILQPHMHKLAMFAQISLVRQD